MSAPRFSVGEYTTPRLSFAEDLAAYRMAGAQGIGIDAGLKLRDGTEDLERLRESGLQATFCLPAIPSILPLPPMPGGPAEPAARVAEMCRSIRDLASFEPICCVCATGPQGAYEPARAREISLTGLRTAARAAADVGLTLALEPMHSSIKDDYSFLNTIPDAVDLLNEVDEPNTGILFDVWHLWDTPDLLDHIRRHARRIVGVHVNDRREVTRSWCDRVLPGDGIANLRGMLTALEEGGYEGWYELEVFSDDGMFGNDFPDSLWKLDPVELIRASREKFEDAWLNRRAQV